ncbi:MAG: ABC transporter substrate-binding protein [Bacillota bacterium]
MKMIKLFSVFALVLSILAACNSGNSGAGGEQEEVTVQFWHSQVEEERVKVIKDIVAKFEEANPGLKVEQVPVPEEDFSTKISASLAANQMPALVEVGVDQALFLGSEKVLETKMHEEIINDIGKDDFFAGALSTMKNAEGEGYYGVPVAGWVQGIWYREDLFKEKGLEAPTTWENILKAAETFHDPDNKKYGIVIGTTKDDFAEQTFSQFALSNNAQIFGEHGKVNFNSPEMIEALDYYKKLAEFTPPGAESWREAREMYLAENAPMVMYSSYIMSDLVSKDMADVTGFATPEKQTKATFGQITSLAIPNTVTDEQKDAAKKFISFLMEKENYIDFLHMSPGGANPTLTSIAEAPEYLDNEILKAYGDEATNIAYGLDNLRRFGFQDGVTYPVMGDISAKFIIGEALYNLTEGGKSAEEVAKVANEKMVETVKD